MGVPDESMEANRPATEQHALDLARATKERLGADWGIGETGAAGPTGNRYGDPPGHSAIGVSGRCDASVVLNTESQDRYSNMGEFAGAALELLERCLEKV